MKEAVISYSHARSNLKDTFDQVCENHESVIITRKDGKNVVVFSEEDYDAMMETLYLMSSRENYKKISESLNEKGGHVYKNLSELRKKYKNKC